MMPSSFALALALIISPELPKEVYQDVLLTQALQTVSISVELMDPREKKWVFCKKEDLLPDLKLIRRRYEEFGDAPPICDHKRFPSLGQCRDMCSENRAFWIHLTNRTQLGPSIAGDVQETIDETNRLFRIWDTARDIQVEYYYISVRRTALKKLRDEIGYLNYYGGFMPPHVPVWRFRKIDE